MTEEIWTCALTTCSFGLLATKAPSQQMLVQLDKASFANASYEQRCEYLEKQLQQTEEYLKTSLTM